MSSDNITEYLENFKRQYPLKLWRQLGYFDELYLNNIDVHWMKFKPTPAYIHHTLGYVYMVILSCGTMSNLLAIYMCIRCRSLRTTSNMLIVNLAICDCIMVMKTVIFLINCFYEGPALGNMGCVIYGFLGGLTGVCTIGTLTAISYDRYVAIVKPLEPRRLSNSNSRTKRLIVFIWIYGFTFAIMPVIFSNIIGGYVPEGWLLPFLIITYCYANVLRTVINTKMSYNNDRLSGRHTKGNTLKKSELKLALLVFALIMLFFISWTPYAVVTLLSIFGYKNLVTPTVSMIPALFCKTEACLNPLVYIISHPNFRKELKTILPWSKRENYVQTPQFCGNNINPTQNRFAGVNENIEIIEIGRLSVF